MMAALSSIVEFEVLPYGNAMEVVSTDGTYTWKCQHGPNECIGNMIEACAISNFPEREEENSGVPMWYPFLECMESDNTNNKDRVGPYNMEAAISCSDDAGLDWGVISACIGSDPSVGSEEGNLIMHNVALNTPNNVTFVPWVVINGVTVGDNGGGYPEGDLTQLVCAAYNGEKPVVCNQYLF